MFKDDDDTMPTMANRGQTPYIPTGYEGLTASAQRKRRIGEALMQKGLAGPGDNVRSWAQVLGSLAQTWAGKSIQASADKEEGENQKKMQADIAAANQAFEADVQAGADPQTLVQKHGANPWVRARLAPYEKALAAGLTNKQEYAAPTEMLDKDGKPVTVQINKAGGIRPVEGGLGLPPVMTEIGGKAVALQRRPDGSVLPQNLTDSVILGPDGKPMVNKDAVAAKIKVAAAGAPQSNTKIIVDNSKQTFEAAIQRVQEKATAAESAIGALDTVQQIRTSLATNKVLTGPGAGVRMKVQQLFGIDTPALAETRSVIQGLSSLALDSRGKITGQGAISNVEQELLQKAVSGDFTDLTVGEIKTILNVSERVQKQLIRQYEDTYSRVAQIPGTLENGLGALELDIPENYRTAKRRGNPVRVPRTGPSMKVPARPEASNVKASPALIDKYSKYLPQ